MTLGIGTSAGAQVVQVGEGQNVVELEPFQLAPLRLVFTQHADRLRVLDDVRRVLRRAVHVDRSADRADEAEREIEEHPLEAGRAQDREGVALSDPEGQEPVRQLLDGLGRLVPRDLAPVLALLDQVGRARPAPLDGVLPQPGDRPSARRGGRGCHVPIVI